MHRHVSNSSEQIKKKLILLLFLLSPIVYGEVSEEQKKLLESLPPDQRGGILEKMETASDLEEEIEEAFDSESTFIKKSEL